MIGLIKTLFDWPNGIVVGNLIASALWAAPALAHLHVKLNRQHREHKAEMQKLRSGAQSDSNMASTGPISGDGST